MWLRWIWVFCATLCAQNKDRDFTGAWKLNTAASQISTALPVPPDSVLHVQHDGDSLRCAVPSDGNIEQGCAYKTDGSEVRLRANGLSISSRTKWEGSALLINSIVSGVKNYTRMDRWTLSRDRNTLRVRRQFVSRYGEAEAVLVYERQPTPTASTEAGNASGPPTRFGRIVLTQIDTPAHEYTDVDGVQVPISRTAAAEVSCLAYEDSSRIYVEVVLRNRSNQPLNITKNFIALEQDGRAVRRTDTSRVSEEVHAGAVRPFKSTPTGKNPRTGEPAYDPASVDEQVQRHLAWQEQESTFAGLLTAMAQTGEGFLAPGQEQTILATFEQCPNKRTPLSVSVRFGEHVFRFQLKSKG